MRAPLASDSSPANRGTGAGAGKEATEELNDESVEVMDALDELEKGRREFRMSSNRIPVVFVGLQCMYIVEPNDSNKQQTIVRNQ